MEEQRRLMLIKGEIKDLTS